MDRIENKKARAEYELLDTYQAGLVLSGGEVKAVRAGKASLVGSYIKIYGNEAWLVNAHIAPYQEKNTQTNYDPLHARKLLLQKKEINELIGKTKEKGFSIIPLQIFDKRGIIKIDIAFARGKKQHDKRETIKKRETKRELDRSLKRSG
ncbi:MAG: SsrA-binding protein SmpB [Patescibacteria group bacterium]|nr:SsrA-binding protein SmpB [Patescibacteria group bacterium]